MPRELVVVIATADRPDDLEHTLASLAGCRRPASFGRVVVVENGPRLGVDGIVARAAVWLRAEYLYAMEANKSLALNAALQQLGDCLVFFTDDDVRFDPGVLCAYERAALAADRGEFYGGPVEVDVEGQMPEWVSPYLPPSARGWRLPAVESVSVTRPLFLGFNWAAFSADLAAVGEFSPAFGPGSTTRATGQETNMQARLLRRGIRGVYVPDAVVRHRVPPRHCSPAWVAERWLRTGIRNGLSYEGPGRRLWGMPAWALRQWATAALRLIAARFAGNAQQFAARVQFLQWHGFLRGSRLAWTQRRE